ncbi:DUF2141 domain-containing protein [Geminicoccus roseus]|uniref:DUF2141 domain-containing protein n=1 Tax=Geminicoccus roseus TaxID=404900 RepID=UPI0004278287|nr:DUF2141 domain-containing protein [Geminicoccus roseus]
MKPVLAFVLLIAAQPALADSLTVRVSGVKEAAGQIQIAVCDASFDIEGCPHGASRAAMPPGLDVLFPDLSPGRYAIAVYQDVDGDGALNKNMLGLPTEPYGFSNDIGRFSPPVFSEALFDLNGDMTVEVTVKPLFGGG